MNRKLAASIILSLLCAATVVHAQEPAWKKRLDKQLPLLGHRNWIVVADAAYPQQTAPGIETIYVGGDHVAALKSVLKTIDDAKHLHPNIYLDNELSYVPEENAPGIKAIRNDLNLALGEHKAVPLPHEEIISKLDTAGKTFKVVLLKTDLTLPYTSVFIELGCGYWSAASEAKMREAMQR